MPTLILIRRAIAPLLTGGALAVAACTKGAANAADSSAADTSAATEGAAPATSLSLPVAVSEARDADLILSVTTTGQVRSDAEAQLKAEVAGTVQSVHVRPGSRVTQGQVLVRLDPRPLDLAVQEAEAAVAEAEVRFADDIVPDSIVTGKAPTAEQRRIALARSGLGGAKARLEIAKLNRERATITAPFAGMVDKLDVAPGERIQAGEPITTVVSLAQLRIEANVLEHDIPLIREGGVAVVSSAAAPNEIVRGRVTAVLPMVDSSTRAGRVYVRVTGAPGLRPGMYADVRLEAQRLARRRLVPAAAVIERDGRPLVFVVKDGRAQWVYINPGRSNGVETEVLPDSASGLIPVEPGDQIIVSGHLTLTHDAPVRVIQADTALTVPAGGVRRPDKR
ncbi:MAG: efflux RND transporter periplasmic adaptor subunit [Gemmatimonadaceae bacterium]